MWFVGLYGAMALFAILVAAWRGDPNIFIGEKPASPALQLALGAGIALVFVTLCQLAAAKLAWARTLVGEFQHLLGTLSLGQIVTIAAASAIGEELLFRGLLLPILGVIGQGVLFGILHVGPRRSFLPWTISSIAIGIGFGYLTVWTDTIVAATVAHFFINACNLHFITAKPPRPFSS